MNYRIDLGVPTEEPLDNPEACQGCGCVPGDGITDGCDNEDGCAYWRAMYARWAREEGSR